MHKEHSIKLLEVGPAHFTLSLTVTLFLLKVTKINQNTNPTERQMQATNEIS